MAWSLGRGWSMPNPWPTQAFRPLVGAIDSRYYSNHPINKQSMVPTHANRAFFCINISNTSAQKIETGPYIICIQVKRALILGRQAGDEILPKFFPPLGSSLNKPALVLRALLWLAPCPEAEIMLLDWARTYPRWEV